MIMRKFFRNITIAAMALSAAVSCLDDRNNFMVDDSLGFNTATDENVIELFTFEGKYDFSVIKSGKGFDGAKATVEPSNAYLMTYNEENRTAYVPLPKDCYSLSTNNVSFGEKEVSEKVTVTWDVDAVNALLDEEPLNEYVIPIRVTSKDLEVNNGRELLILSVSKPVIDFKKPEFETLAVLAEPRVSTESIPMKMTTGYPEDVTVTLAVENDLVAEYVERKNLTGFTAVPEEYAGLISFPADNKLVIPAGKKEFNLDLTMDTGVMFGDDETVLPELFEGYVLPVRATSVSTNGIVLGEDLVYVVITSTYVLPLDFVELWGKYTGTSKTSWFTSTEIAGNENGDRNVAVDDKYVYVPDCHKVGGNYSVFRFSIEDGSVDKVKAPAAPEVGDGFTSCTAKIMKNGVESINGGKDFLVVTNMTQSGSLVLYAYTNGTDEEPQKVTLVGGADRIGDKISIYGNLKDGVEILALNWSTGKSVYSFKFQGEIPESVTGTTISVDCTTTGTGGFYMHPSDRNKAIATTTGGSYFMTSSDGASYTTEPWTAGFAGMAECHDFSYFTINDTEYIAYVQRIIGETKGKAVILENKEGVQGFKEILEKSDDPKPPVAFSSPTADATDFEVSSSVPMGHSALGLSIYETETAVYMAALQQSGGLSVYKLNK